MDSTSSTRTDRPRPASKLISLCARANLQKRRSSLSSSLVMTHSSRNCSRKASKMTDAIGKMTTSQQPKFNFTSRRSAVYASHGVVSSSQPLATHAGMEILKKGGNAADAAVAVAAALNVTEPGSTGIGGDMFCLFYDSKTSTVRGLNGSGRSPAALTLDTLRSAGVVGDSIPSKSAHAVTVPGAAAGWVDTLKEFGSGKITMLEILEPAIKLAEEGFPVAPMSSYQWQRSEKLLQTASPNGNEMLRHGKAPLPGQILKNPTLARTFRTLAAEGKQGFYSGRIAEAILEVLKPLGSLMTLDDLASHSSTLVEPISLKYQNDITLHECPPNGQGLTALIALGIMESLQSRGTIPDLEKCEHNGVTHLHATIEALRLAFADTRWYVADPAVVDVPVKGLLQKEYLSQRAGLVDTSAAMKDVKKGSPVASSDTVYFSVVDEQGNACSFIISNYEGFGTGIIPKGCGFTLQNRGSNFTLEEGHPNCVAPRKRPYHTIIPGMVTRNNKLYLCYGVMGGFMQPQGHLQVLLNMHHFKMDPQAALDAPRICLEPSGVVFVEEGIQPAVLAELKRLGHNIRVMSGWERVVFGRGQVIQVTEDTESPTGRVLAAGSDGRADGMALGY